MDRSWVYRVTLYSLITLLAFALLAPTFATWTGHEDCLPTWFKKHVDKRIMLGLDLQGGLHLVYAVEVDKAVSDKADRLAGDIEDRLKRDKHVKDVRADRNGRDEIVLNFKNPADAKKVDHEFLKEYQKNLYEDSRDAQKGIVKLRIDQDYVEELRDYAVRQGVETIRNRVDKLAVSEPTIIRKGNDIIVELPGLKPEDFERVKKQIGRTAQLEFKMLDDGSEYMKKVAGLAVSKKAEFPGIEVKHDSWQEKDSGALHEDVYLRDKDKSELERFFASLTGDDAVPLGPRDRLRAVGARQRRRRRPPRPRPSTGAPTTCTAAPSSPASTSRTPRSPGISRPAARRSRSPSIAKAPTCSRRRPRKTSAARWPSSSTRRSTRRR